MLFDFNGDTFGVKRPLKFEEPTRNIRTLSKLKVLILQARHPGVIPQHY